MNPKKTTKWLTTIIVILTFVLLGSYITLMSIDAKKYDGWLQIFSISIQLFASFIGVFLALRMSQWISDGEEKENARKLWERILKFLKQLQIDATSKKKLIELAEYKTYWLSVQNASYESAKILHEDEHYLEISSVFSFLSYHESEWFAYKEYTVADWKQNSGKDLQTEIEEWQTAIETMFEYVKAKASRKSL